jgi:hypothetical protein
MSCGVYGGSMMASRRVLGGTWYSGRKPGAMLASRTPASPRDAVVALDVIALRASIIVVVHVSIIRTF